MRVAVDPLPMLRTGRRRFGEAAAAPRDGGGHFPKSCAPLPSTDPTTFSLSLSLFFFLSSPYTFCVISFLLSLSLSLCSADFRASFFFQRLLSLTSFKEMIELRYPREFRLNRSIQVFERWWHEYWTFFFPDSRTFDSIRKGTPTLLRFP